MLEFQVLGSGSAGNCYRLSGGGAVAPLLIEAGLRFADIQRGCGFKVSELAGCLVTHAHGDHARAAAEVAMQGVDVFASVETLAFLPKIPSHRAHGFALDPRHAYERYLQAMVGDWAVLPFDTMHDVAGSLGFVIGSPSGHRLLFLTDSAYSRYRFEGLTHIAVECNWSEATIKASAAAGRVDGSRFKRTVSTHLSLERLIDMLKANDLSLVEEITLLHLSDDNGDEEGFRKKVQEATGIPTRIALARGGVS